MLVAPVESSLVLNRVFVHVGLDRARALHEVVDFLQHGPLHLRTVGGPNGATSSVVDDETHCRK